MGVGSLNVGSFDVGSIDVGDIDVGGIEIGGIDVGGIDIGSIDFGRNDSYLIAFHHSREQREVFLSMQIIVNDPNLKPTDLKGFCVGWAQPLEPETLFDALKGSYRYVIARDDHGNVIGFANAISDGVFAAYIPLVEVLPENQGAGVGTAIMRELLNQLKDLRIVDLMCDPPVQAFYKTLGMIPMVGMRARR